MTEIVYVYINIYCLYKKRCSKYIRHVIDPRMKGSIQQRVLRCPKIGKHCNTAMDAPFIFTFFIFIVYRQLDDIISAEGRGYSGTFAQRHSGSQNGAPLVTALSSRASP